MRRQWNSIISMWHSKQADLGCFVHSFRSWQTFPSRLGNKCTSTGNDAIIFNNASPDTHTVCLDIPCVLPYFGRYKHKDYAAIWWLNDYSDHFKITQERFYLASVKTPLHSRPTKHHVYIIGYVSWLKQVLH